MAKQTLIEKSMIEQKIGEAIGLEKAAQTAVEQLNSRGLLKQEYINKLMNMKKEAQTQEKEMQDLTESISEEEGFNLENINSVSEETAEKASKIMETYLGEDPDTQEALEFLCLAEGGEVTHFEVLTAMSKKLNGKIKNTRKLSTAVNSILREEKRHLAQCTKLAKQTATSS